MDVRLLILLPAIVFAAGQSYAASPSEPTPLPRSRPAITANHTGKAAAEHKTAPHGGTPVPLSLSPAAHTSTPSKPPSPLQVNVTPPALRGVVPSPALRPTPTLAMAASSATSPL